MFERRVKIFLVVLVAVTLVLILRALQIQVVERKTWAQAAVQFMSDEELTETTRGRLLDRLGREIAVDEPCIDACVDYRAITATPDDEWVTKIARARVAARLGSDYRDMDKSQRQTRLQNEKAAVLGDINHMWKTLGDWSNQTPDQIDELRRSIVRKVDMRRRFVWYQKYEKAVKEHDDRDPPPWYQRWLLDDSQQEPELDRYFIKVSEETQPHVIIPDISLEASNFFGKHLDDMPGLVLRPSMHRYYPYNDIGAQLIGHVSKVTGEDLASYPWQKDPLRKYWQNDLIGRSGLEALCEPLLRGTRGRIERYSGDAGEVVDSLPPVPGKDVTTTIDIELQRDIQQLFQKIQLSHSTEGKLDWTDTVAMPGAAVVLDVKTNDVLAIVSYPTYNLNDFDDIYTTLAKDYVSRPLMNRATQFALEPGSTVKPMVGIGAITQGLFPLDGTIECTGYLKLNGITYKTMGRCWVASMYAGVLGVNGVAHHPVPLDDPHPTGFLTFDDALERSCNVFFETLSDKLGIEGLHYWFDKFGLGRKTGIGIPEFSGRIPGDPKFPIPAINRRAATWFSGIGQSQVLATPVQMANVAATIARNGIWMRPHLVPYGMEVAKSDTDVPDRVDLHLSEGALAKAKLGMVKVVNSLAGTGTSARRSDMTVAGKTGSAQAAPLRVMQVDEFGRGVFKTVPIPVEQDDGKVVIENRQVPQWRTLELGTHEHKNPEAPWYRGAGGGENERTHSWYIGFAPAEDPKVAFAVMVEYGGSGGTAAGSVARQILAELIKHRYLQAR